MVSYFDFCFCFSAPRGGGGNLGIDYSATDYGGGSGRRERGRPRERNYGGLGFGNEIGGNQNNTGILDTPFDTTLLQPRRSNPTLPPGLTYQPT